MNVPLNGLPWLVSVAAKPGAGLNRAMVAVMHRALRQRFPVSPVGHLKGLDFGRSVSRLRSISDYWECEGEQSKQRISGQQDRKPKRMVSLAERGDAVSQAATLDVDARLTWL